MSNSSSLCYVQRSSDAAVVLACVPSRVVGAVIIHVAHHAPAVVGVADASLASPLAPPTFIVGGTGEEAAIVVADAIATAAIALIIRGAGFHAFVVLACVPSLVAFAVIIDVAHHAPAVVGVADTSLATLPICTFIG